MTVADFLVGLANVQFRNDAPMARRCRDYATIALQFEEDARCARRERREKLRAIGTGTPRQSPAGSPAEDRAAVDSATT